MLSELLAKKKASRLAIDRAEKPRLRYYQDAKVLREFKKKNHKLNLAMSKKRLDRQIKDLNEPEVRLTSYTDLFITVCFSPLSRLRCRFVGGRYQIYCFVNEGQVFRTS